MDLLITNQCSFEFPSGNVTLAFKMIVINTYILHHKAWLSVANSVCRREAANFLPFPSLAHFIHRFGMNSVVIYTLSLMPELRDEQNTARDDT